MHHCNLVLCEAGLEACILQMQWKGIFFKTHWVQEINIRNTILGSFSAKCLQPHSLKARNEKERVCICSGKEENRR